MRQVRVGLVWAAQVALYPVYGLFQTARLIHRQVKAADPIGHLTRWGGRVVQSKDPLESPCIEAGSTASWLVWLQSFENSVLPSPVWNRLCLAEEASLDPAVGPSPLVGASPDSLPPLQGIATDLQRRSLVLVAVGNHILDVLSAAEQASLSRAMTYLLATQRYAQQRRAQRLAAGRLPLPVPRRRAWWPIQLFQHLMLWMSTGAVAGITNLFGEAEWSRPAPLSPTLTGLYLPKAGFLPGLPAVKIAPAALAVTADLASQPAQFFGSQVELATSVPFVASSSSEGSRERRSQAPTDLLQGSYLWQESTRLLQEASWIEAKATVVSYIDHPLVTVLRWIDQGLLWLETLTQQMWGWVRSHFTL